LTDKQNPRQLAYLALRDVHKGAYADVAIDRALHKATLLRADRNLVTELVYGSVRRLRSLDTLLDQLGKKKANQQNPDLRTILHLGLYQLRYLDNISAATAVNSTVELAKTNSFSALTGVVNGILRQYIRLKEEKGDPLKLPENPVERLGIFHSFPNWIIEAWLAQLGFAETEQLCAAMNQTPSIDLRVNILRASIEEVEAAMQSVGVTVNRINYLENPLPANEEGAEGGVSKQEDKISVPQALRLSGKIGAIQELPGFTEGWWTVQDSSAQLVSYLLDPQPGEVVIDACAAPGGKTTHIAELMGDRGKVWGCDRTPSRLKKLKENAQRLNLKSIQICTGDSRQLPQFTNKCDRALLDAPCSGLGTLNRRADARWRQTPETVRELSTLQAQLLDHAATWVKPGGILVYATCTVHSPENEDIIRAFLDTHSNWQIDPPLANSPLANFSTSEGWIKVLPHRHQMDGFFMVRLKQTVNSFDIPYT
jgi:16S rRNA (cytosine967-C5)-methyltransferase